MREKWRENENGRRRLRRNKGEVWKVKEEVESKRVRERGEEMEDEWRRRRG